MEKIGSAETKWLFFVIMLSNVCFNGIKLWTETFATGAYMGVILTTVIPLAVMGFVSRFLGKTDFLRAVLNLAGKPVFIILGMALFFITVLGAGQRMKELSTAIGDTVLLQSPRVFILLLAAGAVFAVTLLRLEAITRYSLALSFALIGFILIILATTLTETDPVNLYPLAGKWTITKPVAGLYVYADIIYFYLISSHIKDNRNVSSVPVRAVALTGIVSLVIVVFYTLCVPYPVSADFQYPLLRLSLLANSSVVFQRLDALVFLIWIFAGFVSSGALALFAVMILARISGLENQNALCPLTVFMCFVASVVNFDLSSSLHIAMCIAAFGVLPLIALIHRIGEKRC